MKSIFNTLHQYILGNSMSDYHRETVNGLFRCVLEPLISNQKFEACVLFRLFDTKDKQSILKRLSFSNITTYSFCKNLNELDNIEKNNIWGSTEFVIIMGQRYSACVIWDFALGSKKEYSPVCILYNSKTIGEIAKKIADNSTIDLKSVLLKYTPDRRENSLLNSSIKSLSSLYNSKNEELIFSEIEKTEAINSNDDIKTASIVANNAKFVAHEIKNNLSIINLYSKIAEKRFENTSTDKEISESIKNAITNIKNASENISAHINNLRCMSSVYKTEFNIKKSIMSVIEQCREKAKNSGVDINVSDLKDQIINTDKVKFECALLNIIYNAIEACSKGGLINIAEIIDSEKIIVQIKNNGSIIPESTRNKIFEPDYTTKDKGNGLGLAICKKELNRIDGDIKLVHSNDKETLFEITLIV